MLDGLTTLPEQDASLAERLVVDIKDNLSQRPLGRELEGKLDACTFGSFSRRGEQELYIRYQITTKQGYKGVEVKYLLHNGELIYKGETIDWELKQ